MKSEKINRNNLWFCFGVFVLIAQFSFLLYKIHVFPGVFLDEGNGMYDAWCMAKYGVDSHLMKNPVYLQGHGGQGQSILYPLIGGMILKLLGYHVFAYRIPLVVISLINTLLIFVIVYKYMDSFSAFWYVLVIATSPYLLTLARFSMDCNIAPFVFSIGVQLMYLGINELPSIRKSVLLTIGGALIGLCAYSYIVGWIFLPAFLFSFIVMAKAINRIRIRSLIPAFFSMLLIMIPIILFAIRSNVVDLNQTTKIFWWTSPRLPYGRAADSFINIHENAVLNVVKNIKEGISMFERGSDNLSWNSVGSFGPYYMFTFPFFLIGQYTIIRRRSIGDIIILAQLIGMIPIIMFVTPNYNHWIFIHIPVLMTIAGGLCELMGWIVGKGKRVVIGVMLAVYSLNFLLYAYMYFSHERYTGWSMESVQKISEMRNYPKVYFTSEQADFIWFVRFSIPISPYEYQKTKDHPFSEKDDEIGSYKYYGNFERITSDSECEEGAVYLIQDKDVETLDNILSSREQHMEMLLNGLRYYLYY